MFPHVRVVYIHLLNFIVRWNGLHDCLLVLVLHAALHITTYLSSITLCQRNKAISLFRSINFPC
ncbi:hypothetical protein SATMO3_56140 [Sporomusa aerivorans]